MNTLKQVTRNQHIAQTRARCGWRVFRRERRLTSRAGCVMRYLFLTFVAIASSCLGDSAPEPWPRKLRDLPQTVPATVSLPNFRITVRPQPLSTEPLPAQNAEAAYHVIVHHIDLGTKRVFTAATTIIAVLQPHLGWPQFEIWQRATADSWSRSLYRLTGRGYQEIRTDEFAESHSDPTNAIHTATMPGFADETLFYVGTLARNSTP